MAAVVAVVSAVAVVAVCAVVYWQQLEPQQQQQPLEQRQRVVGLHFQQLPDAIVPWLDLVQLRVRSK